MLVAVPGPGDRWVEIAGNPIKLDGAEDPPTRAPAPALDADRERLLAELAPISRDPDVPRQSARRGR
jgi:CoA:oxalate CoA-transferase